MADLDYLKVGNCIKQSLIGNTYQQKQDELICIKELKINKKNSVGEWA